MNYVKKVEINSIYSENGSKLFGTRQRTPFVIGQSLVDN